MLAPDGRQIHDEAVVTGGRVVQRKLHVCQVSKALTPPAT